MNKQFHMPRNMTFARWFLLVLCLMALPRVADGQSRDTVELRTASNAVTAEYGGIRNIDTYLSPLRYSGDHFRISFEHFRPFRINPRQWIHRTDVALTYDMPENPARNNTIHTLCADIGWAALHRWNNVLLPGLNLYAGGSVAFKGGVSYNPRNSNNICSPLIYANIGMSGMATYQFNIGRIPVLARWQPTIPVTGAYYLPEYDQTFYEIYLGNYKNTVNFSNWSNRFDMDNLVALDIRLGTAALRIGYRNEFSTLWKNNISMHRCVHAIVVGIAWESLLISPQKGMPAKARMISALY